jgi:hypothetical protein
MLKKQITYTDFDGNEKTETFYFHLSKANLIEQEMRHQPDGWGAHLEGVMARGDGQEIIETFQNILKLAYGVRTDDGFVKTEGAWNAFKNSEAYSELFMEIVTDPEAAMTFLGGLIPANLQADMERIAAKQAAREGSATVTQLPTPPADPPTEGETISREGAGVITRVELETLTHDEIASKLAQGYHIVD